MRFKQPVRGIHIGGCIDGNPLPPDVVAHAHLGSSYPKGYIGYICARSKSDLFEALLHELAHLAADSGHDEKWRKSLRKLGGHVPAANRKKPRKP